MNSDPTDSGKWVNLTNANECVASAAQITLELRLRAVQTSLPVAAEQADETPEHVHRLRVATRRALAALELYADFVPGKDATWLAKQMKKIRKAAALARDLDVLTSRYHKSPSSKRKHILRRLNRLRSRAQRSIVGLNQKLTENERLSRRIDRVLRGIVQDTDVKLVDFALSKIGQQANAFFNGAPVDLGDIDQLHRFRVQAKAFRYSMELLCDALPETIRSDIYPLVCLVQDHLGEINDHAVAQQKLKQLCRKEKRDGHSRQVKKLARREKQAMQWAIARFQDWFTPRFLNDFRLKLDEILTNSP
ncbi:CHAD domain-containing protein [Stieleria varia]|uniref:CHAD domain protein n=1 Tax=Stieleria varia TaxID=2528005 RepID=A0A5C6B2F9_9BACT|nr:CHAD domain-containing protein [Stieleria varia]TWU06108.1 CHAD domain protein [Stieleria varia]